MVTVQLAELVHLQRLAQWPRLLKKNARPVLAVVTSLGLLAFLFTHLYGIRLTSGRVRPDDSGETVISHTGTQGRPAGSSHCGTCDRDTTLPSDYRLEHRAHSPAVLHYAP